MASPRVETLKNMLEQDPSNAFARYGLAMEYTNSGELEQAVAEYEKLLAATPDYVAAYYHGGQALEKLGRPDDARAIYERGLAACRRKGDGHTASEIQACLDLLG